MLDAERRLFASPRLRAVICISRMVQDDIRERFGLAVERLPIIYNAIDGEAFTPRLSAAAPPPARRCGSMTIASFS